MNFLQSTQHAQRLFRLRCFRDIFIFPNLGEPTIRDLNGGRLYPSLLQSLDYPLASLPNLTYLSTYRDLFACGCYMGVWLGSVGGGGLFLHVSRSTGS